MWDGLINYIFKHLFLIKVTQILVGHIFWSHHSALLQVVSRELLLNKFSSDSDMDGCRTML